MITDIGLDLSVISTTQYASTLGSGLSLTYSHFLITSKMWMALLLMVGQKYGFRQEYTLASVLWKQMQPFLKVKIKNLALQVRENTLGVMYSASPPGQDPYLSSSQVQSCMMWIIWNHVRVSKFFGLMKMLNCTEGMQGLLFQLRQELVLKQAAANHHDLPLTVLVMCAILGYHLLYYCTPVVSGSTSCQY